MLQDHKISNGARPVESRFAGTRPKGELFHGAREILVINCGSTSLKYKLFNFVNLKLIKENNFQHIKNHQEALKQVLREIGDLTKIAAIGHRMVHGGKEFREVRLVNKAILSRLEEYNYLAPLHNPYNISGIKACEEYLPNIPNFVVFDTSFFRDLPDQAKIYPLPYRLYEEGIQKFGFHGISHQYVAEEAAKKLKRPLGELKLITCHLGGGSSICAIKNGKAIDTSMGFTPLEGVAMSTRSGDIDPGIILYLLRNKGFDLNKVEETLNQFSGIRGISGYNNFLDLLKVIKTDERARLAFDIFVYHIKKYIGAYFAVLNGIDAIVFTGSIGVGKKITREKICEKLDILKGVHPVKSPRSGELAKGELFNRVKIIVIPTDEELMIAREVKTKFNYGV